APMLINITSFWMFRIIPSYILLKVLDSPLVPWTFMTVEMFARAMLMYIALRRELRLHVLKEIRKLTKKY
ncbi:MAG TPA: hypothetical protein EYH49_05020, partial [Aquifex aeolicus]|nr:hypothetical protein [Aquifex aeolicus]